ncbi:hypothetical protein [Flavivirga sp. 57AJ16]|uniref:hypothetical protein n=1 Tax=Flavivirga sp. 57AJ16 TaxID=3025307 RepID=UPI002367172E|nr:hypothetical protein [Flavivirga sp. 57AJ16]MDD7886348.1 hypothetical protein [Flavivirga sp. 57AJ16]
MAVNKKYHKRIKEGLKDIFKTETQKGNFDGLTTIVNEPLVKHQIILLAKLCEEIPVSVTLKNTSHGVFIEFW